MVNSQNLGEKVIKGSVVAIFFTFIGSVAAYFIRITYSRSLSIEMYGLFFAVFGFFNIISSYTELGFGGAIAYLVPKYFKSRRYSELWNTFIYGQTIQVGVAVLFSLLLIVFAPVLADKYFKVKGSESLIYVFSGFLILASLLNSLFQIFTGLQKVQYYSSMNALKTLFILFFSLIFLSLGLNNTIFYGLSWIFGYLIIVIVYLYLLLRRYPHLTSNNLSWRKEIFKSMYEYALPAFASTFILSLMVSSDIFLLTLFKGVKEVGVYNVIIPLASIPLIFLSPLNNVLFPLVSHLCEGEKDKLSYLLGKVYQIVPFIGVYFALFIVMFPSSTIGLIFGQKWRGLSELPLMILSLGYIANLMEGITSTIALGAGKNKERLMVYVIVTVVTVSMNIVLIRQFGVLGAVLSSAFAYSLLSFLFTKIIKSTVDFNIPYKFYFKIFTFSLIMYSIVRLIGFSPKNLAEFISIGMIYSIVFASYGYVIKVYDRKLLSVILPKK